jgi:predicted MPP superfamily phosphohydrolase
LSLFLVTFILLYSGLNFYAFLKVRTTLSLGMFSSICVSVFLIIMILAPILVRVSEKAGLEGIARILAYIGYIWMAAILIFFVTGILADIFRLIIYCLGSVLSKDFSFITSAHPIHFFMCLLAALFVVVYGFFEARNIRTEYISIPTNKISADVGRVRIAQISDVHLGLIVGEERLRTIIQAVQQAKPDILVSTGDLVDAQLDSIDKLADLLKAVDTKYGKFAVTGNHEFYAGLDRSLEITGKAGFTILRGKAEIIPGLITIAGVDDEAVRGWSQGNNPQGNNPGEDKLCSEINNSQFTVLLKHRPVVYKGSLCSYDLQLSGHTHKGQIFPFGLVTRLFFETYYGFFHFKNGTYMYVNRGSGTWGPPIRFLAPPEVTIIDLVHRTN